MPYHMDLHELRSSNLFFWPPPTLLTTDRHDTFSVQVLSLVSTPPQPSHPVPLYPVNGCRATHSLVTHKWVAKPSDTPP